MTTEPKPKPGVQILAYPAEGMTTLHHRLGGALPLPVHETEPGVFLSCWIPSREALRELRKRGGLISLVVDTNVPGHPSVSMRAQVAFLVPG